MRILSKYKPIPKEIKLQLDVEGHGMEYQNSLFALVGRICMITGISSTGALILTPIKPEDTVVVTDG